MEDDNPEFHDVSSSLSDSLPTAGYTHRLTSNNKADDMLKILLHEVILSIEKLNLTNWQWDISMMEFLSVSGVSNYTTLSVAAKNEEKKQHDHLKRRKIYNNQRS